MIKISIKVTFGLALVIGGSCILQAQDDKHIYAIHEGDGNYEGAGVEWILKRADSVQFLMFGEQHGVDGIAEFVDFMYQQLHKKGFLYLVLETDGWTTQRSAELGVSAFTQKNPHSIAFDTNGDLGLMQSAIDLNPTIYAPIWGVDQMQTAIHPYARLIELANSSKQRIVARGAYLKATLKMGRYTRQDHQADLNALERIFESNNSIEKEQIIRELRQTIDIFHRWMDPATRKASIQSRELLMGTNFDAYLKTTSEAKAIFKMGGAHTMYGLGPNGVLTFGDHVRQLARQKEQETLSISIHRYNPERSMVDDSAFGNSSMILIDNKQAQLIYPEAKRLSQTDATILLKEAGYASKSINSTYEKAFRNRIIRSVIPLGICLILLLLIVFTYLTQLIRRTQSHLKLPALVAVFTLGLITYQFLQILSEKNMAVISTHFFSTMLHLSYGFFSLYFVFRSVVLMREKAKGKISYLIFTLTFIAISYLIYFWNIGGMLG